jgi:phosphoglycerol transferase MdoB-like AlkP superfamily enzyme
MELLNNTDAYVMKIFLLVAIIIYTLVLVKVVLEISNDSRKPVLQKILLIFIIFATPFLGLAYFFKFERSQNLK